MHDMKRINYIKTTRPLYIFICYLFFVCAILERTIDHFRRWITPVDSFIDIIKVYRDNVCATDNRKNKGWPEVNAVGTDLAASGHQK